MDPIETFEHAGRKIKIFIDDNPESPREWDNLGTILYRGSARIHIGDQGVEPEEIDQTYNRKDVVALPVYAYVHSGTCLNTTGFSCPWDSGQSGIIFVTHEKIKKEYGRKRITRALIKKVEAVLRQEVETYSQYLGGEVYGYVVEDGDGEHIDSLWGMYGLDYCREEARNAAKPAKVA
jgi:hypothetical protein